MCVFHLEDSWQGMQIEFHGTNLSFNKQYKPVVSYFLFFLWLIWLVLKY